MKPSAGSSRHIQVNQYFFYFYKSLVIEPTCTYNIYPTSIYTNIHYFPYDGLQQRTKDATDFYLLREQSGDLKIHLCHVQMVSIALVIEMREKLGLTGSITAPFKQWLHFPSCTCGRLVLIIFVKQIDTFQKGPCRIDKVNLLQCSYNSMSTFNSITFFKQLVAGVQFS